MCNRRRTLTNATRDDRDIDSWTDPSSREMNTDGVERAQPSTRPPHPQASTKDIARGRAETLPQSQLSARRGLPAARRRRAKLGQVLGSAIPRGSRPICPDLRTVWSTHHGLPSHVSCCWSLDITANVDVHPTNDIATSVFFKAGTLPSQELTVIGLFGLIGDTVLFILQIDGLGCREELRRTARADYPESGGSREDQAGRPNRNVDGGLAERKFLPARSDRLTAECLRTASSCREMTPIAETLSARSDSDVGAHGGGKSYTLNPRDTQSSSGYRWGQQAENKLSVVRGNSLGVCSGGSSHRRQYSILNPARISETHPYAPQQNHQSLTWGSGFDRFADHQSVKTATQGRRDPIERLRVTLITRLHVNCREASQVDLERN
ncbi:hypothetical protein Bbelb_431440 [Branchiostoma belcheri]|nr:hypothetical protein Bbelb_431440 [Branchiostoma belcheri]